MSVISHITSENAHRAPKLVVLLVKLCGDCDNVRNYSKSCERYGVRAILLSVKPEIDGDRTILQSL